jgi:hypothetical protein
MGKTIEIVLILIFSSSFNLAIPARRQAHSALRIPHSAFRIDFFSPSPNLPISPPIFSDSVRGIPRSKLLYLPISLLYDFLIP